MMLRLKLSLTICIPHGLLRGTNRFVGGQQTRCKHHYRLKKIIEERAALFRDAEASLETIPTSTLVHSLLATLQEVC